MGHNVVVYSPNKPAEYLMWLPSAEEVIDFESEENELAFGIKDFDAIFCLDFNDLNRSGKLEPYIRHSRAKIVGIDHHTNPKEFAHLELFDSKAPATAVLVYRLYEKLGIQIGQTAALNLYTGLMTDTGSFRFPATTPESHRMAAVLLETGISHETAHERMFDNFSIDRMNLFAHVLANQREHLPEFSTAFMYVKTEDEARFNAKKGDTEGLVNYNLKIDSVVFGVLFLEKDDMIKISFRSKGDFPANEFASKYFQGGGHFNAAGGRSFQSLEKTIERFKESLKEFYEKEKEE